jgi:hypothetical protein
VGELYVLCSRSNKKAGKQLPSKINDNFLLTKKSPVTSTYTSEESVKAR